jgi:hypothetical protein
MSNHSLPAIQTNSLPTLDTKRSLVQGTRLTFVDGRWSTEEGRDKNGARLLVIHLTRGLRRWHDDSLEEFSEDAEPLPDYKAWNEAIPQNEWRISKLTGLPEPPWKLNFVIYLLDLDTYETFTGINSTRGQETAWENLKRQIAMCHADRKKPMLPIVELASAMMKSKMAKLRPDFRVISWRDFGAGPATPQLSNPPAPKPAPQIGKPVEPPTLAEEMDDSIPF